MFGLTSADQIVLRSNRVCLKENGERERDGTVSSSLEMHFTRCPVDSDVNTEELLKELLLSFRDGRSRQHM